MHQAVSVLVTTEVQDVELEMTHARTSGVRTEDVASHVEMNLFVNVLKDSADPDVELETLLKMPVRIYDARTEVAAGQMVVVLIVNVLKVTLVPDVKLETEEEINPQELQSHVEALAVVTVPMTSVADVQVGGSANPSVLVALLYCVTRNLLTDVSQKTKNNNIKVEQLEATQTL
uniref:Uncharacterized protein n=1 Tax=Arion vulgaris TaxID=1028688 RepID=A0A0B7ARZ1_9EUPU